MKYAMCPECGRRLCKGEPGTKVEVECPKCGKTAVVVIDVDNLHISHKPLERKQERTQVTQAVYLSLQMMSVN